MRCRKLTYLWVLHIFSPLSFFNSSTLTFDLRKRSLTESSDAHMCLSVRGEVSWELSRANVRQPKDKPIRHSNWLWQDPETNQPLLIAVSSSVDKLWVWGRLRVGSALQLKILTLTILGRKLHFQKGLQKRPCFELDHLFKCSLNVKSQTGEVQRKWKMLQWHNSLSMELE